MKQYRQRTDITVKQFFWHKLSFCKRRLYCSLNTTASTSNELCYTLVQVGTAQLGRNMKNISSKLHVKQRTDRTRLKDMLAIVDCEISKLYKLHSVWFQQKSWNWILRATALGQFWMNDINSRDLSPTEHSRHFQRDLKITGLCYRIIQERIWNKPSCD